MLMCLVTHSAPRLHLKHIGLAFVLHRTHISGSFELVVVVSITGLALSYCLFNGSSSSI